jgi:general secretion pathway protein N
MTKRSRLLGLAGLAAFLLSQIGIAVGQDAAKPALPAAVLPGQPAAALPSLDELTATRERPLFSSTRRPAAAPVEPEAAPAPIAEATSFPFELVGIVIGSDIRIAIFRKGDAAPSDGTQTAAEELRRKVGEQLGEWAVDEITERYVVLQGDAKRVRLRMFKENDTGIQVGRPGAEGGAVPAGDGDPADKEATDPADSGQSGQSGQVDEEIAPSGTPKVVVPAPRTVVRPPPKAGPPRPPNAQRPPRPQRPPVAER